MVAAIPRTRERDVARTNHGIQRTVLRYGDRAELEGRLGRDCTLGRRRHRIERVGCTRSLVYLAVGGQPQNVIAYCDEDGSVGCYRQGMWIVECERATRPFGHRSHDAWDSHHSIEAP